VQSTILLAVTLLAGALGSTAHAGLLHPGTWKSVSENGKFVFVMLSPLTLEEELLHESYNAVDVAQARQTRDKYTHSGMYLNDESIVPLWIYKDAWLGRDVIIAPDGEHMVVQGAWTYDEYASTVVTFTHRGETIRSYSDREIIPCWVLKAVLNGWSPPACSGVSFNPQQMTYTIGTNQGEAFTFDVTTGNLVGTSSPFPVYYGLAIAAIAVSAAVAIYAWRNKKRRLSDYSGARGTSRLNGGSWWGGSG
jgi:hypothetical protein